MNFKKIFYLILFFLAIVSITACEDRSDLVISDWEILYRETPSLAEARKLTGWQPVSLPFSLLPPYRLEKRYHYLWLRAFFDADNRDDSWYGISPGRIYHTDELYINGRLVHRQTPDSMNHIHSARHYRLSPGAIKKGKNEIYLRIGIFGYNTGGISSTIKLQKERSFLQREYFDNFLFTLLPAGAIVLSAGLMLLCLVVFMFNRNQHLLLLFTVSLGIYLINEIVIFLPISITGFETFNVSLSTITPLVAVIHILVIQAIYGKYDFFSNRVILPILLMIAAFTPFTIFMTSYPVAVAIRYFTGIGTLLLSIPTYYYLIFRLSRFRPDPFRTSLLLIYLGLYTFVLSYEIAAIYFGLPLRYLLTSIFFPFWILIFIFIYARLTMENRLEMQRLYREISSRSQKHLPLSETAEEKINSVLEFISKHHTEDISREGLAAAVDMSPNYLSSLFRQHTGERISDYINEMRIRTAAEKLRLDPEASIISIAFSSGFDSLSTFNRSFKKIFNQAPSLYRDSTPH